MLLSLGQYLDWSLPGTDSEPHLKTPPGYLEIAPGLIVPPIDVMQLNTQKDVREYEAFTKEKERRGLCLDWHCPNKATKEVAPTITYYFPNMEHQARGLPGSKNYRYDSSGGLTKTEGGFSGRPNTCEKHLAMAVKSLEEAIESQRKIHSENPECDILRGKVMVK
jgi:hypothetical protein